MKKVFLALMMFSALLIGCQKNNQNTREPEKQDPEKQDPEKQEPEKQDPENTAECDWADYLITLEYTTPSTTSYGFVDVDYSTLKHSNGKYLYELLGYDDWAEMMEELGELGGSPETGADCLYMGNDPGTGYDMTGAFNTNGIGYWCNGTGGLQNWGDDARIFTEGYVDEEGIFYTTVGVMEGKITAGETYVCRMVFQRTDGDEVIRVGIEFKVTIEALVDTEAGLYDSSKRATSPVDINVTVDLPIGGTVLVDVANDVQNALQLTKMEIKDIPAANYDDETGDLLKGIDFTNYYKGEAVLVTKAADGTDLETPRKHTTSGYGNWILYDGTPIVWGTEGMAYFIEMHVNVKAIEVLFGTDDPYYWEETAEGSGEWQVVGDNTYVQGLVGTTFTDYKTVITYIPEFDEAPTVINVNYTINFLAEEEEE